MTSAMPRSALVFVAGGCGLAGSAVVRQLLALTDFRIRVSHRSNDGLRYDNPRVEYVKADLTSAEDCRLAATGCDTAVMAAAITAGARSATTQPWLQVTDNVVMDMRMLEAFHACGIRRVVYVSTATVYQEAEGLIRETDLRWDIDPPAAYFGVAWAKRYAEKACRFWHEKSGMEILIARLANVFGPGARFSPETSHFVAALVRKAHEKLDPFEIWGKPDVTRDIIFADDFGRAVVAMLMAREVVFDTFNIGSGRRTTVDEVVRWALAAAKHKPSKILYDNGGPTTIPYRALDCSKAQALLGWQPEIGIEEGIQRTADWWISHRERWNR